MLLPTLWCPDRQKKLRLVGFTMLLPTLWCPDRQKKLRLAGLTMLLPTLWCPDRKKKLRLAGLTMLLQILQCNLFLLWGGIVNSNLGMYIHTCANSRYRTAPAWQVDQHLRGPTWANRKANPCGVPLGGNKTKKNAELTSPGGHAACG